ncbi:tetratricopeptide repeat protein [Modestobacter sp. VKM Ac-2979]|uniref:tetratricopeptide repeat protein n=1 Tax=unclassified Modestobacter TaxID=2643866 RepID=UPI0022AB7D5D|nr:MULTISPECIES: tetratricopeptide repeat protein [unclassified Modestobacter]MCZ2812547.1 tetratricopeptide repeat protein [Modestobacter sp. VKM Ac-2979]MCZ2841437.1 tetratricopeptide repeat protein [Modestobacter sp. VKM Ac-2980]
MQPNRPARTDPRAAAQQAQMAASLAGAVDLAAVQARNEAAARAAAAPPPSATAPAGAPGSAVIDVTEETFQSEVLDRSFQVPVVLDLWAEWCGPCKQLSPVLERLATEGAGSWVLAKVDVDANPALAQGLRVQGIPAVKAVWQGQLVAEFTGAIPEEQARQFVTELVAATSGGAVPGAAEDDGEAEEPEDPRLDAAEAALDRGDLAAAEAAYQAILETEPEHPVAGLALRQVQLFRRAEEAGPDALAAAEAAPDDIAAQTRAADFLLGTGDVDAAFGWLLDVVRRTAGEERDAARQHLVELFGIVGDEDPRVGPARRALMTALF